MFATAITKGRNKYANTSKLSVFARRLGIKRLPLVRSFLLRLDHVAFDLVSAVGLGRRPRQLYRVFVDVLDRRRSGLSRLVCNQGNTILVPYQRRRIQITYT